MTAAQDSTADEPSALSRAWRGWPGLVARLAIAILPLLWLANRVTFGEILEHARTAGLGSFALAILALLLASWPAAMRWKVLLHAYGARTTPGYPALLRHLFVCIYFNALPSGIAGDLIRAHRVRDHLPTPACSYAVVFVERITGLLGLLLLAALAAFAGRESGIADGFVTTAFIATTALAAAASSVLFLIPHAVERSPALARMLARIPVLGAMVLGIPKPRSVLGLGKAVLLSLFTQGAALSGIILLTRPLVESTQLAGCIQVMPLAILLTYIPLTPGGIAQREAIYAYLFAFAGVAPAIAVAVSLLFFAAQMAMAALGGLVHFAEKLLADNR